MNEITAQQARETLSKIEFESEKYYAEVEKIFAENVIYDKEGDSVSRGCLLCEAFYEGHCEVLF